MFYVLCLRKESLTLTLTLTLLQLMRKHDLVLFLDSPTICLLFTSSDDFGIAFLT